MSAELEQRVRVLESQLRVANAELAKLRRRAGENGAHGKRLDQAYADALLQEALNALQASGLTHTHALAALAQRVVKRNT